MSKHDGGPPAFPSDEYDFQPLTGQQVVRESSSGMSLLDYFAAAALQGIIASQAHPLSTGWPARNTAAIVAYEYADAMLAERSKQ